MSAIDRVTAVLRAAGVDAEIREFPAGTRTAPEAAAAVGCEVGQICKSLVFRVGAEPLLVVASGTNRVDESRFGAVMADARFVRDQTGFAIGGVPPVGHARPIDTVVDEDLLRYEVVWAAAGTPRAVFAIAPERLVAVSGARVARVSPGT
ncbi:MAG TPA: YbaK/EbsC family protein [Solirubrobacteraceae bacterium]|nr:YbaK/EbsC family protein [Solirubrobacteraceae bacterium]